MIPPLTVQPLGPFVTFFSVAKRFIFSRGNTNLLYKVHGKVYYNIISDGYETCRIEKKSTYVRVQYTYMYGYTERLAFYEKLLWVIDNTYQSIISRLH